MKDVKFDKHKTQPVQWHMKIDKHRSTKKVSEKCIMMHENIYIFKYLIIMRVHAGEPQTMEGVAF